ncbi:hypothetical protein [Microbulbifer litoralis]|uniref:hypothetical protein n=1 Tax=Microbulbifer litoralis TaxID=2933965 RepID=UPI0020287B25|nr:hypothetical protein [Microbulbifer sp. GX H0434]
MMPRFVLIASIFMLSGCATRVTWDGLTPSKSYQIIFKNQDADPVSGVSASCNGNGIWPSDKIAQEINEAHEKSDSSGLLKLSHSGYEVGGTYKKLGPFTWGGSEQWKVYCTFIHRGSIIESGKLAKFNQPVEITVPKII